MRGVFASTLLTLTEAGRIHTPAGQNALLLASWMDNAEGDHGGGKAALSKQHLAALAEAMKDTEESGDLVDELQARRAKRASSA